MKEFLKKVIKRIPIPLTQNHKYDILTRRIISDLPPDSNCIDVGCYRGEILDLMLKSAPLGRHFGVEPLPSQFEYLSEKYAQVDNCHLYNIAASNVSGVSDFNYVISNPSYSGIKKRDYDKPNEKEISIQVNTESLDNIIKNIPIDLIKIDVEVRSFLSY